MLTQAFPKLKNNFFIGCVRDFFRSPAFAAVVVILMAVAETQSLEIEVYYFYLALLLLGFLFTEDTLCAVPIACCGYMTLSPVNSPAKNPELTAFGDPVFLIQFVFILALSLFLLAAKFVMLCVHRQHRSGEKSPFPVFGRDSSRSAWDTCSAARSLRTTRGRRSASGSCSSSPSSCYTPISA